VRVAPVAFALVLTSLLPVGCSLEGLDQADVGDAPSCLDLATWPADSRADEDRLVELIDDLRASGTMCGDADAPGVEGLQPSPTLRCTARRHAADLARHADLGLAHTGSDGSMTLARANASGYDGITRHEIVGANYSTPEALLEAWTADAGTCELLMDGTLDEIAAGQAWSADRDRVVWVVVTGQVRP
jgi:uncharacterized protein YkwD